MFHLTSEVLLEKWREFIEESFEAARGRGTDTLDRRNGTGNRCWIGNTGADQAGKAAILEVDKKALTGEKISPENGPGDVSDPEELVGEVSRCEGNREAAATVRKDGTSVCSNQIPRPREEAVC